MDVMIKLAKNILVGSALVTFAGCTGFGLPGVSQMKPFSYINHGDQFGRDQLANRWLVGKKLVPLKGRDANEVTTLLGQPQEVQITKHNVSEDWYFVYYKAYKTRPNSEQGSFLVRFYQKQVIDVISLS